MNINKLIKIILCSIILFNGQGVFADTKLLKNNIKKEIKKYGLFIEEYKEKPFRMIFDASNSTFPVTLGLVSSTANSIKQCPDVLRAGKVQEFGKMKKIDKYNEYPIYLIPPPKDSRLSSVLFSYKNKTCLGMFGSAGQKLTVEDKVRLSILKVFIKSY